MSGSLAMFFLYRLPRPGGKTKDLFSHHFVSSLAEATTLFLFFPNLALISARFVASKMEWLGFIIQTIITSQLLCHDRESNSRQSCTSLTDLLRTLYQLSYTAVVFRPLCYCTLST